MTENPSSVLYDERTTEAPFEFANYSSALPSTPQETFKQRFSLVVKLKAAISSAETRAQLQKHYRTNTQFQKHPSKTPQPILWTRGALHYLHTLESLLHELPEEERSVYTKEYPPEKPFISPLCYLQGVKQSILEHQADFEKETYHRDIRDVRKARCTYVDTKRANLQTVRDLHSEKKQLEQKYQKVRWALWGKTREQKRELQNLIEAKQQEIKERVRISAAEIERLQVTYHKKVRDFNAAYTALGKGITEERAFKE